MNILTFDIEEWYIEKIYNGNHSEKYRQFDEMLDKILNLLSEVDCKATFFCLGKIATDFPHVIRKITAHGHEIGCHSNEHVWLTKLTPEQLKRDTHDAIAALQDVSGQAVESYRAPAFSIGETNKWAIEILAEEGIKNDSSIFPAVRDFGGFLTFTKDEPCIIDYNGTTLKEFPIPIVKILGKKCAYSGGGYFRLFPYWFTQRNMKKSNYGMCYFHISDLISQPCKLMSKADYETYFRESGTLKNRVTRYLKSSLGRTSAFAKMERLIVNLPFVSLSEYLRHKPNLPTLTI